MTLGWDGHWLYNLKNILVVSFYNYIVKKPIGLISNMTNINKLVRFNDLFYTAKKIEYFLNEDIVKEVRFFILGSEGTNIELASKIWLGVFWSTKPFHQSRRLCEVDFIIIFCGHQILLLINCPWWRCIHDNSVLNSSLLSWFRKFPLCSRIENNWISDWGSRGVKHLFGPISVVWLTLNIK